MFFSVTRLRLRSAWFFPGFFFYAQRSTRQARNAPGCLGVKTRKTRGLAFWTLTRWRDEAAMRTFRSQPPHGSAMPKLARWCDEAAVAHWEGNPAETPSWDDAVRKLQKLGRLSPVDHPSKDHEEGRIGIS